MLPSRPDRDLLHAFAVSTAILSAAAFGVLAAVVAGTASGILAGSSAAALLYGAARARPDWLAVAYRQWRRLMRAYARLARAVLIRLIHFVLITPVARLGGDAGFWQSPTGSGWLPHQAVAVGTARSGGWWRKFGALSRGSTGAWVLGLVPLLAALRLLDRLNRRPQEGISTTTYTLY